MLHEISRKPGKVPIPLYAHPQLVRVHVDSEHVLDSEDPPFSIRPTVLLNLATALANAFPHVSLLPVEPLCDSVHFCSGPEEGVLNAQQKLQVGTDFVPRHPLPPSLSSHCRALGTLMNSIRILTSPEHIYARSSHSYPRLCTKPVDQCLEFQVADSYVGFGDHGRMLLGVADGVGHGPASQLAAQAALHGVLCHLLSSFTGKKPINSTHTCIRVLLEAVLFAAQSHVRCLSDQNTTLLCGMLAEIESPSSHHKWVYSGVSVGDTKLYRCSVQMGSVQEITMSDPQKESVRDAGGHLGEHPSFLNLHSICCVLDEGDILLSLSDGVHDNLEPEYLGISPHYFGFPQKRWSELPQSTEVYELKKRFRETRLSQVIGIHSSEWSPQSITDKIMAYVEVCH